MTIHIKETLSTHQTTKKINPLFLKRCGAVYLFKPQIEDTLSIHVILLPTKITAHKR